MTTESIKVCCRFRQEFDHLESDYDAWGFDETSSTITLREKKWTYDFILPPETTQEIMYEKVAKKTINEFCDGYHGTIFAYGQSGSGKTYSMLGPDSVFEDLGKSESNELYGITPRAIYQIFSTLTEFSRNGTNWKLSLSYIEIYNEKIKCLLSRKDALKIREDPNEGFIIPEKEFKDCKSPKDIFEGIDLATKNRAVGATNQNERSSRSHAIMQLELIYNSIDGLVRKSSLSLVDLAGSERIAKTGAEGQRLKEAQKINQSLTTLGMVIMALTTSGSKHIPFRNSKLTLILKDSLGGSSKTTLLCTASRLKKHSEESIQTLYFASRAKIIKNSTKKNVILNAGELQYIANGLKKEVMILRGIMKKNGFMWRNIEDKKILGFIGNDEFLKDDGNYNTGNDESENNNLEDKKEKKEEKKSNVVKKTIVNCNDVEIKNMKINMDTEKVLLQRIIDELNERIDNKDKENINLKKKIEEYIFQIGQCENLYQEKKALENELEEQKRIFNQKDGEFNKINSELSLIEIENENLNNQIQEQENSLNNNIEQYGNEIQILKKENSDKNNLLKELEIKVKNEEENRNKIDIDFKKKEENWNNELKLFKENLEKLNMLLNDKIIEKNILNENEKKHSEKLLSLREINSQTISENEKLKRNLLNISIENNNEINKMKNNYDKIIDEDKISLNIKETKIKDYETQIKFINSQIESQNERLEIINKIAENQKKEIEENSKKANIDNEKLINENKELNLSMKNQEEQISKLEKENKQLNQKLLELEKQMQIIKQTKSNVQNKNQISNNLITNNNTHNSKKTENTQISKNAFGIVLKKINKNENSIDFLGEAIKQAKSNSKLLLELNKNRLDLLSDLKQNIDYDSPKTVSSVSLNEEDIPQLDFANGNNEEIFKKAEDILIEKELQRKVQKELRMSTMNK